jgi:hypothetical protein
VECLQRLDASSDLAVCANAGVDAMTEEKPLNNRCLHLETPKEQTIETKHVTIRKLCVALQLPIGDDVSALHPLQSSVGSSWQ